LLFRAPAGRRAFAGGHGRAAGVENPRIPGGFWRVSPEGAAD